MLFEKLHIVNFRSITDLVVDMRYPDKSPRNVARRSDWVYFDNGPKRRALPVMALYGANASGKSNVIQAISRLRKTVVHASPIPPHKYMPNRLNPTQQPTRLAITFTDKATRYHYGIVYDATGLLREWLTANGRVIFSLRAPDTPPNRSPHLTAQAQKRTSSVYIKRAYRFFQDLQLFDIQFQSTLLPSAIEHLAKVTHQTIEETAEALIQFAGQLDASILNLTVTPDDKGPQLTATYQAIDGQTVDFAFFKDESEGTQRLLLLIATILIALHRGAPLFADEIARSIHPIVMREVLSFFKQKRLNPNCAQLFFTTHMTDILDDQILALPEVALLTKTLRRGTQMIRVSDLKRDPDNAIRSLKTFKDNYMAGYYRGVPYPAL